MLLTARLRTNNAKNQELADLMLSQPMGDNKNYIEYKRLNFFIGKNNSGKSQFLRLLFSGFDFYRSLFFDYDVYSNFKNGSYFMDFERIWHNEVLRIEGGTGGFLQDITMNPSILSKMKNESVDVNKFLSEILSSSSGYDFLIKFYNQARALQLIIDDQVKTDSFYIPVLRGLRRMVETDGNDPYENRTLKDYFKNSDSGGFYIKNEILVTGENIYKKIKEFLLGEPEQRDLIRNYEDLLSQYFFDGQQVSLIPKHDSDVVHIKIGDEKQFPIYHLGDGLQQAIILTYQCYLQKDSVCAFFIEEPELHMHAGMVRQLMNFYLNETKHYYFFTTHSNHLLDMVDESDEVVIQKFTKKKKDDGSSYFEIKRCNKDRELLAALGVRPSSVYLANCTIWVEGITDRLYLVKYMQKYLEDLKNSNDPRFLKYRGFMPNFHYTFVEYQGSNLVHWNFDEEDQDLSDSQGLNALSVCSDMLLIADGDIQGKGSRVADLQTALGEERFYLLPCKETENTLPPDFLFKLAMEKFKRMEDETKIGFDGAKIKAVYDTGNINIFANSTVGIGRIFDNLMRDHPPLKKTNSKYKAAFAVDSGTVKDKVIFCREMLKKMDDLSAWELTDEAKALCEKIFTFIDDRNQDMLKPQDQ